MKHNKLFVGNILKRRLLNFFKRGKSLTNCVFQDYNFSKIEHFEAKYFFLKQ